MDRVHSLQACRGRCDDTPCNSRHRGPGRHKRKLFIVGLRLAVECRVNEFSFEITFVRSAVVVVQTPLAHHSMTLEAGVVHGLDLLRHFHRIVFEETFNEGDFAVELGVEDWVAAGESHR